MKEILHCGAYIRYVYDIVVFDNDKQRLWAIRQAMEEYLSRLRLSLHSVKTIVVPVMEGVDHLGYRVSPDHRRLRKDDIVRFQRRMRKMQENYATGDITLHDVNKSVQSWLGHAKHADTYLLRDKILSSMSFQRNVSLRRIPSCA